MNCLALRTLTFLAAVSITAAMSTTRLAADQPQWSAWPSPWATAVAADGADELLVATADGLLLREAAVCVTPLEDPTRVRELYRHPVSVWAVARSDGLIASSDYRGNLAVLDRESGEMTLHENVLERWTRALAFAPDGGQIVAGNEAGKLFVWATDKSEVIKTHELDASQIYCVRFSPDGSTVAASDGAGHVHLLSWPELEPQREITLGEQPLWGVAFAADGEHLWIGGAERKLWRVSVQEGSEPEVVAETSDWITSVAVDPRTGAVAACTQDGKVLTTDGADDLSAEQVGELPSSGWGVAIPSSGRITVATRKHAVATLGRAWTVLYAEEPPEEPEIPEAAGDEAEEESANEADEDEGSEEQDDQADESENEADGEAESADDGSE